MLSKAHVVLEFSDMYFEPVDKTDLIDAATDNQHGEGPIPKWFLHQERVRVL